MRSIENYVVFLLYSRFYLKIIDIKLLALPLHLYYMYTVCSRLHKLDPDVIHSTLPLKLYEVGIRSRKQ